MRLRLLSIVSAALCCVLAAFAEQIQVTDVILTKGGSATVEISFGNEHTDLVAFQMDLTLPEGISIDKAGCGLCSRITDEKQELVIGKLESGGFRLTSTSLSLTPISGTEGPLLVLKLNSDESFVQGVAAIGNILFSTSSSERVAANNITFTINTRYALTYMVDGKVYKTMSVAYGATITPEPSPTRKGMAFSGWGEVPETMPAHDVTLRGSFSWMKETAEGIVYQVADTLNNYASVVGHEDISETVDILPAIEIGGYTYTINNIGENSFSGCSGLTSVIIPNGVTTIGGGAFAGCSSLETIYCFVEDVPDIQEYTFGDIDMMNQVTLIVPDKAVEGYVTHPVWGEFKIETPTAAISCLKLSPYEDSNITSGFYNYAFLKRRFDAGWHTSCLPFAVSNIEGYFGEGTKAYEFCSYADDMLGFSAVTSLVAGYPYILYVPAEITDNIMWKNIDVDANDTEAHFMNKDGIYFRGSYSSIGGDMWEKESDTDVIYGLTNEGRIVRAGTYASISGFCAYFDIPAGVEVKGFRLEDEGDAINLAPALSREGGKVHICNMAGQRIQKMQRGINIVNGKKVLK